jgi:hypothetical protein
MRIWAQTAMIENGFVHLPEAAPWLAQYLDLSIDMIGRLYDRHPHPRDRYRGEASKYEWCPPPMAANGEWRPWVPSSGARRTAQRRARRADSSHSERRGPSAGLDAKADLRHERSLV